MTSSNKSKVCALHTPTGDNNESGGDHWYCDRVNVIKCNYLWKIDNFTSFQGEATSPVFTANNCSKIKWQVSISKIERIVILKLKLVASNQRRLKFKFKATVLNSAHKTESHTIGKNNFYTASPNDVFIFPRPIEIEAIQSSCIGRLQNTLALDFDISVIIDIMDSKYSGTSDIESTLHEDMGKLLESGKFSDVSLIVAGRELRAHKAILSMRSEVFAAMFDHEMMKENTSNRVAINDFDFPVIQEMLSFMYSNKSTNIDAVAVDLLAAADKYALNYLKIMCADVLERDIAIDTVLPTLVLADRHGADFLRARSLHFIKANISTLLKTDAWQTMVSCYPNLIDDIENYNGCI